VAKETYIETQEHYEDDNLGTKIENLEAFIPLVDDALFDYLITVGDKEYQILIHAEDYDHTTASRDDDITWACADEGAEIGIVGKNPLRNKRIFPNTASIHVQ